jgi:hypothetical protein
MILSTLKCEAMKKIILLTFPSIFALASQGQLLLNEVYSDPGKIKSEFFELYNASASSTPISTDDFTLMTYFESPTERGFLVMDLPNLTVGPKGYFVGSADLPYDYQGVLGSTASDFSWNSAWFTANHGYIKKWVKKAVNLLDGNPFYDEEVLPVDFDDFFYRLTGTGASFSIFLYQGGVLKNALNLGCGGASGVLPAIINMPPLWVDMSATATDFIIDFSIYGSIPAETVQQDAGSDNGFIRTADGICGSWTKSSAQVQHTPKQTNGFGDATMGVISTTATIVKGTAATGSNFIYDVVSAPVTSFPVTLQVYKDGGVDPIHLDPSDVFIEQNVENVVTDGPFNTNFFPYTANMMLVVVSSAGCIDKIMYSLNEGVLPLKFLYFTGQSRNNSNNLQWKIANNETVASIEILRSYDGVNFSRCGMVSGTNKTGDELYNYTEAASTSSKVFYKLKLTNKANATEYSTVISISTNNQTQTFRIVTNPVKDNIIVNFNSTKAQVAELKLYSVNGALVKSEKISFNQGSNIVNVLTGNAFHNSGIYIAELNTGEEKFAVKFLKQ